MDKHPNVLLDEFTDRIFSKLSKKKEAEKPFGGEEQEKTRSKESRRARLEPTPSPKLEAVSFNHVTDNFVKSSNAIFDVLQAQITPQEFSLYMCLYRLSYGFNKATCKVGFSTLKERTGFSKNTLKKYIRSLVNKKLIDVAEKEGSLTARTYRVNVFKDSHGEGGSHPDPGSYLDPVSQLDPPPPDRLYIPDTSPSGSHFDPVSHIDPGVGHGLTQGGSKFDPVSHIDPGSNGVTKPFKEPVQKPQRHSLKTDLLEDPVCVSRSSLQDLEYLVSRFYELTRQKTSTHTRTRALDQAKTLLNDGFSLEEIEYALEWTVKNKPKVHAFGFVVETIGEALKERERDEQLQQRLRTESERKQHEREREEARGQLELRVMELHGKLTTEERAVLRRQAEDLVLEDPDPKGTEIAFVKERLVSLKEKQLLKERHREMLGDLLEKAEGG